MEFNISPEDLKTAIQSIKGGLGTKSLLAQYIKILVKEKKLFLYTNSVRIGYTLSLNEVDIVSEGEAIVDGATFPKFVEAANSSTINISSKDGYLYIRDGRRKSKILNLSGESFVDPVIEGRVVSTISLSTLQLLVKTSIPMAAKNTLTELSGVCLKESVAMATDKVKGVITTFDSVVDEPIILTIEAAREIMKLSHEGEVKLVSTGSFLAITIESEYESISLVMQVIQGDFPDMREVADKLSLENKVAISVTALYSEINYMALSSDNDNQVFTLSVSDKLRMSTTAYMGTVVSNAEVDYDKEMSNITKDINVVIKTRDILSMLSSAKAFIDASFFDEDIINLYISDEGNIIKIELEGMTLILSTIST